MSITETLQAVAPPLEWYEGVTLRVQGTRIPLDTIVHEFERGATAEQIVMNFDTLKLTDVYAVIAYYLRNRPEVEAYLAKRKADQQQRATELDSQPFAAELRQRLSRRSQEREREGHSPC